MATGLRRQATNTTNAMSVIYMLSQMNKSLRGQSVAH